MASSKSKPDGHQTSLFDEATLTSRGMPLPITSSLPSSPPLPGPPQADGRSTAVWHQWLSSMASDAEAALAAAIAYRDMDAAGRESWLSSLELDAPKVDVPPVALYAPLLAVENDPDRRERLIFALGDPAGGPEPRPAQRALSGINRQGERVFVVATPLYLNFFQVLACGVFGGKFVCVRHDPIVGSEGVPSEGDEFFGAQLSEAPMKSVLDELAANVLSHQRSGMKLPDGLSVLGDLLGPLGP